MKKKVLMLAVVILLVFLLGVQAFEISSLKKSLVYGENDFGNAGSNTGTSSQRPSQQAAPTMVGGC